MLHGRGEPGVGNGAGDGVGVGFAVFVLAGDGHLDVLAHVEVGAFVGASEQFDDFAHINVLVGTDGEGQFVHVHGEFERWCKGIENEVFALAEVLAVGVGGIEGFPEDELAFAVPQAVAAGDGLDIVRAHEIFGVATLQTAYAGDVAADAHVVVGDALGSPYAANLLRSLAKHFKYPHLVFVGYGQAFAAVAVAILLHQ